MQARQDSDRTRPKFVVKVEARDEGGQLLHEGDFPGEFPDRQAAVAAIELHLQQFDLAGYDTAGDFWWGRSSNEPYQYMRYFIRA